MSFKFYQNVPIYKNYKGFSDKPSYNCPIIILQCMNIDCTKIPAFCKKPFAIFPNYQPDVIFLRIAKLVVKVCSLQLQGLKIFV